MKAKKALGQHFLIDETLTSNIAHSLTLLEEYPRILEIGPGQGVLTQHLLKLKADFKAVELDQDMVQYLLEHLPDIKGKIINIDFLKVDFEIAHDGQEFLLIGNFPYNISTEIVFKMIDNRHLIPEMVGMFQKEVADRIVAPHGSKIYGVTSVLTQAFYSGETLFAVPPSSFNPPPKVQSSVIRLVRKEGTLDCNPKKLRQVVKTTFNNRRKMLRNTLKPLVDDPSFLEDKLFTLRPEQLSVENFIELTNRIEKANES